MPLLLLADDSPAVRRVIGLTFAGRDIEIRTADDGDQALSVIERERPDIVLAEVALSRRTGYDICAYVKARADLAHIPVLLLAGAFEPVDEARAREVRCDGLLIKPLDSQQLAVRIQELLDGAPGSPARAIGSVPRPIDGVTTRWVRDGSGADDVTLPATQTPPPAAEVARPETPPVGSTVGPATVAEPAADAAPLDDYFSRLDRALAGRSAGETRALPASPVRPMSTGTSAPEAAVEVPTVDALLADSAGPVIEARDGRARQAIADAFAALRDATAAPLPTRPSDDDARRADTQPDTMPVSEALIEEVTRRVIARLAPGAVQAIVADVVADVAERLVREEIVRARNRS